MKVCILNSMQNIVHNETHMSNGFREPQKFFLPIRDRMILDLIASTSESKSRKMRDFRQQIDQRLDINALDADSNDSDGMDVDADMSGLETGMLGPDTSDANPSDANPSTTTQKALPEGQKSSFPKQSCFRFITHFYNSAMLPCRNIKCSGIHSKKPIGWYKFTHNSATYYYTQSNKKYCICETSNQYSVIESALI
jgi:hypothetical protein